MAPRYPVIPERRIFMKRSIFLWTSLSCCLALSSEAHGDPGSLEAAKARTRQPLLPGQVVTFKNAKSKLCIGVEAGQMHNGALLKQGRCTDAPDQKWRVDPRDAKAPDFVYLRNVKNDNLCMGVDGAKVTSGANIGVYDCHFASGVSNQKWLIAQSLSGLRQIINQKSTLHAGDLYCVGVDHAKTTRAQLKQFRCDFKTNQSWAASDRG
jgi:hypothetical protein